MHSAQRVFFQKSRLQLGFFLLVTFTNGPKVRALTPSDPKIRARKFDIFALTRAVAWTLEKRIAFAIHPLMTMRGQAGSRGEPNKATV